MGHEVGRRSWTERACWAIAELLSRLLAPDEREVVLGDLVESDARPVKTLQDLLGLVVRRQAALWLDWRPWLAALGIALPLGMVFSVVSRAWADGTAIYAFLYINQFDWVHLDNPGSRHHMIALASGFLLNGVTLAAWSWTAGFTLGRLSHRAVWVTAVLFAAIVLAGTVGTDTTARINNHNANVFSLRFYGVVFPRLLRVGAVLLPALWGIRRAMQPTPLPWQPLLASGAVLVLLTMWSARAVEDALIFGRGLIPPNPGADGLVGTVDDPRPWIALPIFVLWPTAFIVASVGWQKWRERVALALLVFVTAGTSIHAQSPVDYLQWRGAQRDGSASAFVEPASWPPALTRRWRVEVGEGYGTPLVVGNTVYVFTRREGNEVITALEATTGEERWRSGYAAPYSPSQPTAAHGSGPKATPLFHDGRLFTQGVSGIVSAFNASNGTRLWRTKEPAEHPFFSAASSPAGEGGLLVVHPGNYEPLTAFDAESGEVEWVVGAGGFFMSPLIVALAGTRQVVTVTQSGVSGVSLPDGRLLWQSPWKGGGSGGSMPIAHGDTIIVGADTGLTAIRPVRRGETWTAETVWEAKDVSIYLSNPVVVGDTVFGLSTRDRGRYFAIDARDGRLLWLGPPRAATNTAIVKSSDLLFLLNDDGELIVARASRDRFDPIARYTVSESPTWAQPAISGNRLFVKDADSLTLWTIE